MFSPSHSMVVLISVHIILYCHGKSGHHSSTKAVKNIVVLSASTGEKACICNAFHSSRFFDNTNTNTIFYVTLSPGLRISYTGVLKESGVFLLFTTLSAFLLVFSVAEKDSKRKIMRGWLWYLFVFYLLLMINLLFLDGSRTGNGHFSSRFTMEAIENNFRRANLVPFATIRRYMDGFSRNPSLMGASGVNLIGNLLAFVPLAVMLPLLAPRLSHPLITTGCILGIVVLVELCQAIFSVGMLDVDDVLLNTIGAAVFAFWGRIPAIQRFWKRILFL